LSDTRRHRIVAEEIVNRVVAKAGRLRHRIIEARPHCPCNLVDRASTERVVRVREQRGTPGRRREVAPRFLSRADCERRPRLDVLATSVRSRCALRRF
jgi:hypothetical protein